MAFHLSSSDCHRLLGLLNKLPPVGPFASSKNISNIKLLVAMVRPTAFKCVNTPFRDYWSPLEHNNPILPLKEQQHESHHLGCSYGLGLAKFHGGPKLPLQVSVRALKDEMDGGMSSNFQGRSWNLAWKLMSLLNKD
ncbi:hypothetical protein Gohar_007226 [Gossypium harknessii]|uniref:Uncharacterized protein n=1 Tax=Gossypium harknessii TaxID=34285 RepID=A0A7J9GGH7_9ROSI|nr:hypothetical protein [Gossypium harknessii]